MAGMRSTYNYSSYSVGIVVLCLSGLSYALQRSVGSPSDTIIQPIADECGANNPRNFGFGRCPALINCVLDKLPAATSAGFSSGTAIAALIPTIMGLLGTSPQDLIELAMFSPIRAIVTSFFGLGLPSSLFSQLRPILPSRSGDPSESSELTKEWTRAVPAFGGQGNSKVLFRVAIDMIIVGLGAVMLWRNVEVGWTTMVTWRCDYSFLLIVWPIACFAWLIVATTLLCILSSNIEVFFTTETGISESKSFWNLLVLPYQRLQYATGQLNSRLPDKKSGRDAASAEKTAYLGPTSQSKDQRGVTEQALSTDLYSHCTVRISMASSRGIRSWRVFEAAIETMAAGLYLYATFVLGSTIFLSGENAIVYASVMALCMLAIRLLIILF